MDTMDKTYVFIGVLATIFTVKYYFSYQVYKNMLPSRKMKKKMDVKDFIEDWY